MPLPTDVLYPSDTTYPSDVGSSPYEETGTISSGAVASAADVFTASETGTVSPTARLSGVSQKVSSGVGTTYNKTGFISARARLEGVGAEVPQVGFALYESLLYQDRAIAWWGLDATDATPDGSGHGYTLTVNGTPTAAATLLPRGDGTDQGSRDFNGTTGAYWTNGTLYSTPTAPPAYHSATAAAGNIADAKIVTPDGVQAGDLVIACLVHATPTATITTAPAGWTQIGTTLNAGTCAQAVYRRNPVVDEPPEEFTWTWNSAAVTLSTILVYRNCDQAVSGLVYDYGQQTTVSASDHSTTTETAPVQSHALALWCGDFVGTITPDPTGLKNRVDISTGQVKIVAAEYDSALGGSITKTATTSAHVQLGVFLLTFGAPNDVLEDALDALSSNISLHALIRPDTVAAGTRTVIRKQGSWGLQINGATVEFLYFDGGGTQRTITGPTVSASVTTHLVVTDDGSLIHFYKNGVETTSTRLGTPGYTLNSNRVSIGAFYSGGAFSNFFDGRIDEVAVFSNTVSDQMVATWYAAYSAGTFGQRVLGEGTRNLYPRIKVEIAFDSAPTDTTLIWEDVTADLRAAEGIHPTRGRNFELDRMEAGRMDFTLENRDRQYDPTYASSPYYPNVKPTRAVRLRAQTVDDGIVYPIFFGYTEGHPQMRMSSGLDATARFTVIDPFKALALDQIIGTLVRPQELTGSRMRALLDGFPGVPYTGEEGKTQVVGDELSGVNSLDHAQQVAETDGGILFSDANGYITFQDRHHRTIYEDAPRVSFGVTTPYPISHMEPLVDEARLFTSATVTPASGNVQSALSVEASLEHWLRTKQITTLHASDADAMAMANAFANHYSIPNTRIPNVLLLPAGALDPMGMWAVVLAREISHRIRTLETPLQGSAFAGTVVPRDHFIEGIRHSITQSSWSVVFDVSPAELDGDYFIIGQSRIGDTSTVIGW